MNQRRILTTAFVGLSAVFCAVSVGAQTAAAGHAGASRTLESTVQTPAQGLHSLLELSVRDAMLGQGNTASGHYASALRETWADWMRLAPSTSHVARSTWGKQDAFDALAQQARQQLRQTAFDVLMLDAHQVRLANGHTIAPGWATDLLINQGHDRLVMRLLGDVTELQMRHHTPLELGDQEAGARIARALVKSIYQDIAAAEKTWRTASLQAGTPQGIVAAIRALGPVPAQMPSVPAMRSTPSGTQIGDVLGQ